MNNFKCSKTEKEFHINSYTTSVSNGELVYKDSFGKILINPDNGEPLVEIEREIDWSKVNVSIITGNGNAGKEKRIEQLKKRSSAHYKREVAEVKYEKNKELIKKFEEK